MLGCLCLLWIDSIDWFVWYYSLRVAPGWYFSMLCQMLGPACHVSLWIDSIDLNQIDLCSGQWYWSLKFVPGWSFNANAGCQIHHQAKDSGSLYFYTQGQKPWTGIVVSEETKQKCGLDWLILLPQVFWPMSTFVGFAILVICVNLFIMDQQAGLAFLPVMVLSTVTASASLQGPSAASEDDDQEKWLDDKLQQISSLDFYDFLAFSKFNRRWCCFCSWKIETTCIEIEIESFFDDQWITSKSILLIALQACRLARRTASCQVHMSRLSWFWPREWRQGLESVAFIFVWSISFFARRNIVLGDDGAGCWKVSFQFGQFQWIGSIGICWVLCWPSPSQSRDAASRISPRSFCGHSFSSPPWHVEFQGAEDLVWHGSGFSAKVVTLVCYQMLELRPALYLSKHEIWGEFILRG